MPKKKKKTKKKKSKKIKVKKIKTVSQNFHIYTFGGLNETNKWLSENNYA